MILECDLETHGFVYLGWRGNPSDDPRWAAAYLDRIERTVERDKNHPSVIIWSLGNESGTGRNLAQMAHWVHRRDPERPVHYEGDYTGAYTDLYSRMYPELRRDRGDRGRDRADLLPDRPGRCAAGSAASRSCCVSTATRWATGPARWTATTTLFERYPRLHGGFIWEWRDHGLRTRTPDGAEYFGYGGDFGEVVHDGNFVMDGMVLPDGTPTPGLAEFAAVNAPVTFVRDGEALVATNRQHTRSTAGSAVRRPAGGGRPSRRSSCRWSTPASSRAAEATLAQPASLRQAAAEGETWLTVRAELAE